jgi:PBP1b-binding outer membrane lipoprotein LpoB
MKKLKTVVAVFLIAVTLSSCATILGGKVTAYQTTRPEAGKPPRQIRAGYLIADVLLTGALGVAIDFVTGAIYQPAPAK